MFANTNLSLQVFAPDRDNPISLKANAAISDQAVEFDNAAFFDLQGDPFSVVSVRFDLQGTVLTYTLLQGGSFADVDDATGFNGYKLVFDALTDSPSHKIIGARYVEETQTFAIPEAFLEAKDDTIWMNVDDLRFSSGQTVDIQLDLGMTGDAARNVLEGSTGNDKINGKAGADILFGGLGQDKVIGGAGRDVIDGGGGNDTLKGGGGADNFVMRSFGGRDKLRDFTLSDDRIVVDDVAESFADLALKSVKKGTLVDSGDAQMLLIGIDATDLTADHFVF